VNQWIDIFQKLDADRNIPYILGTIFQLIRVGFDASVPEHE
jgi:hypothetical protein